MEIERNADVIHIKIGNFYINFGWYRGENPSLFVLKLFEDWCFWQQENYNYLGFTFFEIGFFLFRFSVEYDNEPEMNLIIDEE